MFELRSTAGQSSTVDDVTVTPRAQALIVRLPFFAFVWNRPVAIEIGRNGTIERIPIHDLTRIVQLVFLGIGLALPLTLWFRSTRRKEQEL